MAGLVFNAHESSEENVGSGIRDPLKDLVYRVHPLPESLVDYVFDFGALHPDTEKLYIRAMLKSCLAVVPTAAAAAAAADADAARARAAAAAAVNPQQAANAELQAFKTEVLRCVQGLITTNQVCRFKRSMDGIATLIDH